MAVRLGLIVVFLCLVVATTRTVWVWPSAVSLTVQRDPAGRRLKYRGLEPVAWAPSLRVSGRGARVTPRERWPAHSFTLQPAQVAALARPRLVIGGRPLAAVSAC